MEKKRILIVSDTHNCHIDWYGVPTDERMDRLTRHICEEYEKDPYEMILFLGDYSLDHWKWQIHGSWLAQGRSYTKEWIDKQFPKLPDVPKHVVAGNHEQYGDELWNQITGQSRTQYFVFEDYLFILWDSFSGDLDPDFHHDGAYRPIDADWLEGVMEQYPDKKIIMGSHFFIEGMETEKTKELISSDRVLCIFAGHNHAASIAETSEKCGKTPILYTGNYSYYGGKDPAPYYWGFRDLYLSDTGISSKYIIPENDMVIEGEPRHVEYQTAYEYSKEF